MPGRLPATGCARCSATSAGRLHGRDSRRVNPVEERKGISAETTLRWIAAVKPERAILTNLHVTMDYRTLSDSLPPGCHVRSVLSWKVAAEPPWH